VNPQPFGLRSAYPIFIVLAVAVALVVIIPAARRVRLPLSRLFLIQAIVTFVGLTGAVLYNLYETGALDQFGPMSYVSSGLRYPGGIIFVILVLPLVRFLLPPHLTLAGYVDLIAAPTAFAMAVMRGGCFLMGCCYGTPSDLPWALRYSPLSQVARHHVMNGWIEPGAWSLPVHPLHLYFAIASAAVGFFLLWFQKRKTFDGQVFLLYLALHEGAKGGLEFLRGSVHDHSVVHLRVMSLALAVAATMVLMARSRGWFMGVLVPARPAQRV
jgi:phosphatidylglycerol:prolipoprotein diacylglycerol transferase